MVALYFPLMGPNEMPRLALYWLSPLASMDWHPGMHLDRASGSVKAVHIFAAGALKV